MVFVVYTMEAKNGLCGVHYGRGICNFVVCKPWKLKMVFVVYTTKGDLGKLYLEGWQCGSTRLNCSGNKWQ